MFMEKKITLVEALSGIDFVLTHLDGRKVRIRNAPGEVVKPDEIKTVEGQGMPMHKKTFKNGNLFIQFKVEFPKKLDKGQIAQLSQALNFQINKNDADMSAEETCKLEEFQEQHKNTHHEGGQRGQYDDEDDDEDHNHG